MLCIFVLLLPIIIPALVIWIIFDKIGGLFLRLLLKSESKKIAIFRGNNLEDMAIIDEKVISKIRKDVLVFPEECSSKLMRFLISKSVFRDDPSIFVISGNFRGNLIPLKKTLAKFKKGNRIRLKNIVFKLKSSIGNTADPQENAPSISEFKKEIVEELITMAKSQDSNETELYIIPIEDYEEDFGHYNQPDLYVAWLFIDTWCDESEHGFPGFHHDFEKADWPAMARSIAQSLETDSPISVDIQKYFKLGNKK